MSEFPKIDGVAFRMVSGFSRYCVGDNGTVWALPHSYSRFKNPVINNGWIFVPPILHTAWCKGYPSVTLTENTRRAHTKVHTLVLTAFVGPRPDGMEACHLDGTRTNNNLSNLRWDTRKGNARDSIRHGVLSWGSKNHTAKINDDIVREMKALRETGLSYAKIGKRFGLGEYATLKAVTGQSWKHVI